MACCITVHIVDNGEIRVSHDFWGETEEEARGYLENHLASCEYFKSNWNAGTVIEEIDDEIDRPEPDEFDDDDDED